MSTRIVSPWSLVACIGKVESEVGGLATPWTTANETQARFLEMWHRYAKQLPDTDMIKTFAAPTSAECEAWLAQNGFPGQKLPGITPPGFGAIGLLDLLVLWEREGVEHRTRISGQMYPGFKLPKRTVTPYVSPAQDGNEHVFVQVPVKQSGINVYIGMFHDVPTDEFDMVRWAKRALEDKQYGTVGAGGLICPMVNIETENDRSWLPEMGAMGKDGMPAIITAAKNKNRLRMNHKGARAQAYDFAAVTRGICFDEPLVIDGPFVVIMTMDGCDLPILVAYIDKDGWKDPGNLD